VGSGRGVFLFPFMEEFSWIPVTSIDILPERVEFLENIHRGGIEHLCPVEANLCEQPFPENSFDVITLLEVLEHIPDVEKAVNAAVNMARKYIVVSVPSKPDNNPEHIHLLTKEVLTELFTKAGCRKLKFDGVNGHLIMVASL
jgi:2-polyprenyl-3-methyl-5-hydroxy-6-metoxy-1,4-benzoquinol methylase